MLRSGDGWPFRILEAKMERAAGEIQFTKVTDEKWKVSVLVQPRNGSVRGCDHDYNVH